MALGIVGVTAPMLAAGLWPIVGRREWFLALPPAQVVLIYFAKGVARLLGSTRWASLRHARSSQITIQRLGVEKLMEFTDPGKDPLSRQALEGALGSGDPEILRSSATRLFKLGLRDLVADALAKPFVDPERAMRVSYLVGDVLRVIGPDAAGPLLRRLESLATPTACRTAVLYALRGQKDESVVRGVRGALGDPDAALRAAAVEWVGVTDPAGARELLLPALNDPAPAVRSACLRAFEARRDRSSNDDLLKLTEDAVPAVRRVAMEVLGALGEPRVAPSAVRALKDPDDEHRYRAILALGTLRAAEAVDPLLAALEDSALDLRPHVARSLGQIGDSRAVGGLAKALRRDPLYATRVRAAEALGSMGWRTESPADHAAWAIAKGDWNHPFVGNEETLEGFDAALKDGDAAGGALLRLEQLLQNQAAQVPDSWLFRLSELDGIRGPMEERRGPELLDCQPVRKAARAEIARRAAKK